MVTVRVLGLLFLLATATSNPATKKLRADDDPYRLPSNVVPNKYTITLTIPDEAFTAEGTEFDGIAIIDFTVNAAITEIKFHVSKEFITISSLTLGDSELHETTDYTIDPDTDILTIPTEGRTIEALQSYTLTINYKGKISTTDNYGLYKSSYTNAQAETVYLLATQFQTVYARRVFPCFDEPSFKATYDVSVIYPGTRNLGVLFNTEKTDEPVLADGVYTVSFVTTPVMSSYLVALVVSDFTATTAANVVDDEVTHVVWSRANMADSRAYAQQVGPLVVQNLNTYTDRLYGASMTKLDQIAIPDFSVVAMENWGLVTYREPLLLWNAADSSTASKQATLQIIAHELAHQWFGNLITCNWWSEAFLNEGFATYFEYVISQQIEPNWQIEKQFVVDILQSVLESDSLIDSQALQSDASTPLQISDKFGQITYNKGASIVRMLQHIMGEANFKAGIQEYFKTAVHLEGTSIPSQLWDILNTHITASTLPDGVTLTTVMQNWIEKPGYPLLTVTLDGRNLIISQERFLQTGTDAETKWYVPITYTESTSTTKFQDTIPVAWLTPEGQDLTLPLENDNTWVILNSLQTGYYRVTYDTNLWNNIATALNTDQFDGIVDLNRAQIVDDVFNLAQAGKLLYSNVFGIIEEFLKKDTSYFTWVPAFKGFNFIMQKIPEGEVLRTAMETQLLDLIDALYKTVTFEELRDDDQIYTKTQVLAITWACKLGLEDCKTKVNAAFDLFKTESTQPNKNLRNIVYCNALRYSEDVTNYEFLWNHYTTIDTTAKDTILNALGCTTNEVKLNELLNEIIKEDSLIRYQYLLTAFSAVYSGSQRGTDIALDFLIANLPAVFNKLSSTGSQRSLIRGIAAKLTNEAQVQKLRTLVDTHADFPEAIKVDSTSALTQAQANIKWVSDHQADLMRFYGIEIPTTTVPTTTPSGVSVAQINMVLLVVVSALSVFGFLAM